VIVINKTFAELHIDVYYLFVMQLYHVHLKRYHLLIKQLFSEAVYSSENVVNTGLTWATFKYETLVDESQK